MNQSGRGTSPILKHEQMIRLGNRVVDLEFWVMKMLMTFYYILFGNALCRQCRTHVHPIIFAIKKIQLPAVLVAIGEYDPSRDAFWPKYYDSKCNEWHTLPRSGGHSIVKKIRRECLLLVPCFQFVEDVYIQSHNFCTLPYARRRSSETKVRKNDPTVVQS